MLNNACDFVELSKSWELCQWHLIAKMADNCAGIDNDDRKQGSMIFAGAALQPMESIVSKKLLKKSLKLGNKCEIKQFAYFVYQIQLAKIAYLSGRFSQALSYYEEAYRLEGELVRPLFYDFLCQLAEEKLKYGFARDAIQIWQDIASILQEDTPEYVYHRMSHCYAANKHGFGGTKQENHTWGDSHKHDVMDYFHAHLQPDFYFEIGVDQGYSLARAKGRALGVDARPKLDLKVTLPDQAQVMGVSSDGFFRDYAKDAFITKPDLAFIDGMHLFEFALRDFMNLEQYAAPYALVGIDDIYPCHPIQAERRRCSNSWTGDVWKLLPILKKYRPDLTLVSLRCATTGLLLIAGMDKKNTQLKRHYSQIIAEFQRDIPVPEHIINREGSLPSDHPVVSQLLNLLNLARKDDVGMNELRKRLDDFRPILHLAIEDVNLPLHPVMLDELRKEKELSNHQSFCAQLFIPQSTGPVYSEEFSSKLQVISGEWQLIQFDLKAAIRNMSLRLDPSDQPGLYEIGEIKLIHSDTSRSLYEFSQIEHFHDFKIQGDAFQIDNDKRFLFYAYANDPIIIFPKIDLDEEGGELIIYIRRIEDNNELRSIWNKSSISLNNS